MFSVNQASYDTMIKALKKDISDEIVGALKDELVKTKPYYEHTRMIDSFVYDETASLVGSEEWSAAAVDKGGDWIWNKFPPINKILLWVQEHKSPDAPLSKQKQEAYLIARKIKNEGIDSTYYVDFALSKKYEIDA